MPCGKSFQNNDLFLFYIFLFFLVNDLYQSIVMKFLDEILFDIVGSADIDYSK